jgi:hypothetical protein
MVLTRPTPHLREAEHRGIYPFTLAPPSDELALTVRVRVRVRVRSRLRVRVRVRSRLRVRVRSRRRPSINLG